MRFQLFVSAVIALLICSTLLASPGKRERRASRINYAGQANSDSEREAGYDRDFEVLDEEEPASRRPRRPIKIVVTQQLPGEPLGYDAELDGPFGLLPDADLSQELQPQVIYDQDGVAHPVEQSLEYVDNQENELTPEENVQPNVDKVTEALAGTPEGAIRLALPEDQVLLADIRKGQDPRPENQQTYFVIVRGWVFYDNTKAHKYIEKVKTAYQEQFSNLIGVAFSVTKRESENDYYDRVKPDGYITFKCLFTGCVWSDTELVFKAFITVEKILYSSDGGFVNPVDAGRTYILEAMFAKTDSQMTKGIRKKFPPQELRGDKELQYDAALQIVARMIGNGVKNQMASHVHQPYYDEDFGDLV